MRDDEPAFVPSSPYESHLVHDGEGLCADCDALPDEMFDRWCGEPRMVKAGDVVTVGTGNRKHLPRNLRDALKHGRKLVVIEVFSDTRKVITREASKSVTHVAKVECWDGSVEYVSANVLVPSPHGS